MQIDGVHPDTQFWMDHKGGIQILQIKPLPQTGKKHHRKFQPLAFMDRHDPHRILFLSQHIDFPEIHLAFLQLFDITDEVKQSPVAGLLIIPRLFLHHADICASLLSGRHGLDILPVTGLFQNQCDQLMNRGVRNLGADLIQQFQKGFQLFPQVFLFPRRRIAADGVIQTGLGKFHPHRRQFPGAYVADGRRQHAGQGDILSGIVADMQIV